MPDRYLFIIFFFIIYLNCVYYLTVSVCYFILVKFSLRLHTWPTISYLFSIENTNMSYTVERIINLILDDKTKPWSCVKDPCCICKKTVKTEHKVIFCDSCKLRSRIVCNSIALNEYGNLKYKSNLWYCLVCNIKNNLDGLLFT